MEKRFLSRRLSLLEEEGVQFRTGVHVGVDVSAEQMRLEHDAMLLAGGAEQPRDLEIPGRDLKGIHFAMEYLTQQNRICEGDVVPEDEIITAEGKRVVIIGGGDTGADCLGTAHRQGAASVAQLELLERPPDQRAPTNPWPNWPDIFRVSPAHAEGGDRVYAVSSRRFSGDPSGCVSVLHAEKVDVHSDGERLRFESIPDSEFEIEVDLVLLAMGFLGPVRTGLLTELGVTLTGQGHGLARRTLDDERAWCFHRGRHAEGAIAHRLGHRRGPERGAWHRYIPDGRIEPPGTAVMPGPQSSGARRR